MEKKLLTSLAHDAYKKGDYEKAFALYQEAAKRLGADFFKANLLLSSKHILNDSSKENNLWINNIQDAEYYVCNEYEKFKKNKPIYKFSGKYPKVSVVVTAFNAGDTIERSVISLLMQNYPDLEVVVCDDMSTDNTWDVLNNIKKQSPKSLKIIRLNVNGGTYLAKNVAIAESSGEIILFQDSDDYSHPERVMAQVLPLIKNEELMATRTKYLRFDPLTKKIVPVAGFLAKYGFITLAVRREVFEEIGYFDAVRKAGDDEWFQRLVHFYGKDKICNLDLPLYLAELRSGSLIADMLKFNEDGSVDQSSSVPRRDYVRIFSSRFKDKSKSRAWYKNNFKPYPLRANRSYPNSIFALPRLEEKIYGNVCCIPSRLESFKKVVNRVLPQVDELFVYLDKFEEVPSFLLNNKKISILRSQDADFDYRDNAKFIKYNGLREESNNFYYFTFDDDINYPYDYVRSMIKRIDFFDKNFVLGVHGVIYEEDVKKYFRRRIVYHFQEAHLAKPKFVNNLGTGTVAFHSKCISKLNVEEWDKSGMVDIFFANSCRENNVPMVCIDRHSKWLVNQEESENTPTLFGEYNEKEQVIVSEIRKFSYWGYKAILDTLMTSRYFINSKEIESMLPSFAERVLLDKSFLRFR